MTLAPLAAAAAAGLAGSPHCVGMCGPFAAASAHSWPTAAAWHAGRLLTYATLGLAVGALGEALPAAGWIRVLAVIWLVAFSARLAGLLPELHLASVPGLGRALSWAAKREGAAGSLAFGALSGLMPCGLVYAALAVPMAAADPLVGGVSMLAFGLGTVPLLAGLSTAARGLMQRSARARIALAALVLVSGLASIAQRAPAETGEAPACHAPS